MKSGTSSSGSNSRSDKSSSYPGRRRFEAPEKTNEKIQEELALSCVEVNYRLKTAFYNSCTGFICIFLL